MEEYPMGGKFNCTKFPSFYLLFHSILAPPLPLLNELAQSTHRQSIISCDYHYQLLCEQNG
jgi:hypothetical protein